MKKNFNDPRGGMIIFLGVLLAALWLAIAYGAYEESKRAKYDVRIKPGAVTYGTRSTAVMPTVSVQTRRTHAPMVSGSAVRSYAHSGHATMPRTSSSAGYRLHTTSSATVHTIGSGGGGGGGSMGASGGGSSSRGISYSGGSVSMPTLAMASTSRSAYGVSSISSSISYAASSWTQPTSTTEMTNTSYSTMSRRSIRRSAPSPSEGSEGDWEWGGDSDDDWWYKNEYGKWVHVKTGDTRYDPFEDCVLVWNGSAWVKESEHEPEAATPVGDAPWHWMLLMVAVYALVKTTRKKHNAI